jgi:hypothetical protein
VGFIPRRAITRPPRLSFIIPIGGHVFVHCRAGGSRSVPLADESGHELSGASLVDGVEVEVVAWRPRGPTDTRYRVRATDGERSEGWVFAQELRRSLIPAAEAAASVPAAAAPAPPVAQRAHDQHRRPARPDPADNTGRRFGQRF